MKTRVSLGRAALASVLCAMACQTKQQPAREAPEPSQLVSRAEAPQPEAPRRPVPPLPDPLPGVHKDVTSFVGGALRAAIGDLDGDGKREIVLVDATQLRVVDPSGRAIAALPVTRGIQVLVVADIDGDGRAKIYAGWGVTREHKETKAAFTVYRLEGRRLVEEILFAPDTPRQDVSAIVPMPDASSILLAYFDSKYNVASVIAKRATSGWAFSTVASIRMATSYARGDLDGDGTPDLVVGRMYGDATGADGDAFVLAPDGKRTAIPSTRGLRSIAIADADGDGRADVFMGDGWNQNYGEKARGLLTWARHVGGEIKTELVEDTAGQYAIEKITPAIIGGRLGLVTLGSHYVRVFQRSNDRWLGSTIAGPARDIAVGDLDGAPGDELLIVGDKSEIVSLGTGIR